MKRYQLLAREGDRRKRGRERNDELGESWARDAEKVLRREFYNGPSGSGIDDGTQSDLDDWDGKKIVFYASFHHMNDCGYYVGWTEHVFTVYPDLQFGFNLKISGPNRNDIKEYLADVYNNWLNEEI